MPLVALHSEMTAEHLVFPTACRLLLVVADTPTALDTLAVDILANRRADLLAADIDRLERRDWPSVGDTAHLERRDWPSAAAAPTLTPGSPLVVARQGHRPVVLASRPAAEPRRTSGTLTQRHERHNSNMLPLPCSENPFDAAAPPWLALLSKTQAAA